MNAAALRDGTSQSCGCFRADLMETKYTDAPRLQKKHPRLYRIWLCMKTRCLNAKHFTFENYGGRGVKVCEQWRTSFEAFLTDMGDPAPGLTLERIDNEKGYEPGNCKWANRYEQGRNKRNNIWFDWKGQKMILSEVARTEGVSLASFRQYMVERGLSTEDAVALCKKRGRLWKDRPRNGVSP